MSHIPRKMNVSNHYKKIIFLNNLWLATKKACNDDYFLHKVKMRPALDFGFSEMKFCSCSFSTFWKNFFGSFYSISAGSLNQKCVWEVFFFGLFELFRCGGEVIGTFINGWCLEIGIIKEAKKVRLWNSSVGIVGLNFNLEASDLM